MTKAAYLRRHAAASVAWRAIMQAEPQECERLTALIAMCAEQCERMPGPEPVSETLSAAEVVALEGER